jgi:hypothetical protein
MQKYSWLLDPLSQITMNIEGVQGNLNGNLNIFMVQILKGVTRQLK